MDGAAILAIAVVVTMVIIAAIYSFFTGPSSPLAASWKKELHELDVKVRMGSDESLIDDLRSMSKLQRKLGNQWEAEKTLRRALQICEQQWGRKSPHIQPVLGDLAELLVAMHRKDEATQLRKQLKSSQQQ